MTRSELEPGPEETLGWLAGDWRIFQLRRGHRWATDDVLTAWTALEASPEGASAVLDLGAGVGSVGLLVLQKLSDAARLTAVEVQAVSAALLHKTVTLNDLAGRVDVRLADLRHVDLLGTEPSYDLITANPPYLPPERAVRSPHPQRAAARLELHGDVFDYCRVAAGVLAPDGRFCFCHAAADPRPVAAVHAAGLAVLSRQEVVFRAGQQPHLALFTCGHTGPRRQLPALRVRTSSGARTPEYHAIRRALRIDP